MKLFIAFICIVYFPVATGQITIQGTISDDQGQPLAGANIFVKGTYYGATSDTSGKYRLSIPERDTVHLMASYLGYQNQEQVFTHQKNISFDFNLRESADKLDEVVITAGTFSAGDRVRAGKMDPLDIVSTASAEANIYAALSTLPGAQTQGETGKIIVRGGESYETKTYMDGLLVTSPYTSSMPDMPARGRFSPFLFNGVIFSTGGYSAEYGQALSSVLVLNSTALADEDQISLSFMNVGVGSSVTNRTTNSSYTIEGNYTNTWPYFQLAQHDIDWTTYPQSMNANARYRIKTGAESMLKVFVNYDNSHSALEESDPFSDVTNRLKLHDQNVFTKASFAGSLGEKWMIKGGAAYNRDNRDLNFNDDKINTGMESAHFRMGLLNYTTSKVTLKGGAELLYTNNVSDFFNYEAQQQYNGLVTDNLVASFMEADIRISNKMATRLGGRFEHSSILNKSSLVPRFSLAYKTGDQSQVSFAYGQFRQNPQNEYLLYSKHLNFEESEHFILNYQYEKNKRLFRAELYSKKYAQLITYGQNEEGLYTNLNNTGKGYAQGLDLFWRDQYTISFLDYRISYSYTDTKRIYQNFPVEAVPDFVSKHTLSVVAKYWVNKIRTQFSLSYNFRSGRPYYNPADAGFHPEFTKAYNDISGSLTYLTNIFDRFTVVYLSVTNLPGFNNVYGYRYSDEPDSLGNYASYAITPETKRTIVIGIFISLK